MGGCHLLEFSNCHIGDKEGGKITVNLQDICVQCKNGFIQKKSNSIEKKRYKDRGCYSGSSQIIWKYEHNGHKSCHNGCFETTKPNQSTQELSTYTYMVYNTPLKIQSLSSYPMTLLDPRGSKSGPYGRLETTKLNQSTQEITREGPILAIYN